MKRSIIYIFLTCVCFTVFVSGQQADRQVKEKFVIVPDREVMVVIAYQPGSPLQFEEVKYLVGVKGGGTPSFSVRNNSNKPIRSFTVGGPWGTETWSEKFTKKLLMPGETDASATTGVEIVSLSDEMRDKLKPTKPMRAISVLMVVRVEYADGSVFSAEPTYEALQEYTERLTELQANAKSR